jgi:hypothetical protein
MTTILSFDDAFGGGKAKIPRSSVTGDIGFAVISRLNRFKTLEAGRDDSAVVNDSTIRRKQAFLCYDKDEQPKGNPVKFIADALTEFLKESIRKAEFGL